MNCLTVSRSKMELRLECELGSKIADVDIMEVGESITNNVITEPTSTCILSKRKSLAPAPNKPSNLRVSMKPRKHPITENAYSKQFEALYLNKKIEAVTQALETIYEEPESSCADTTTFIGGKKIKRLLTFQKVSWHTKEKIDQRKAKIKKLLENKSFANRKNTHEYSFKNY